MLSFYKTKDMTIQDRDTLITALQNKKISLADIMEKLMKEGYLINKTKMLKLSWVVLLEECFRNISIFDENRQRKLILFYTKLMT